MIEFRTPWDSDLPVADSGPKLREADDEPAPKKPRGRRPLGWSWGQEEPDVDFVYCQLTITCRAGEAERFAAAARGSGVIPWQLDFAAIEEDIFNLAVAQPPAQRSLTVQECRVLARQFRARVEARQARAEALIGRSRACPFDLQTLLPVPHEILKLGPAHPTSLAWLRLHWGPAEGLRQIAVLAKPRPGKRLPAGHGVIGYDFMSRDWPPAAAVDAIAAAWPPLQFTLRHRPTTWDRGWIG